MCNFARTQQMNGQEEVKPEEDLNDLINILEVEGNEDVGHEIQDDYDSGCYLLMNEKDDMPLTQGDVELSQKNANTNWQAPETPVDRANF